MAWKRMLNAKNLETLGESGELIAVENKGRKRNSSGLPVWTSNHSTGKRKGRPIIGPLALSLLPTKRCEAFC
jgi:hypothetical protein